MKCLDIGGGRVKIQRLDGMRFPFARTPTKWISLNTKVSANPHVIGSVSDIPFDNETFDFVRLWCFPASEVTPKSLLEIERVLRPNGFALILTGKRILNRKGFDRQFHTIFDDVAISESLYFGVKP